MNNLPFPSQSISSSLRKTGKWWEFERDKDTTCKALPKRCPCEYIQLWETEVPEKITTCSKALTNSFREFEWELSSRPRSERSLME